MFLLLFIVVTHVQSETLLEALSTVLKESDAFYENQVTKDEEDLLPEYDFIVVGAGAAGCAVTGRLTEISEWSVLLLEAGPGEEFFMDVPYNAGFGGGTVWDWGYRSQNVPGYCLSYPDERCSFLRGKVMGGSSTVNGMSGNRGSKDDYDSWERLGNVGWGYDGVLPYFKKSENMTIPEYRSNTEQHGTQGPITISQIQSPTNLAKAFIEAARENGFEINDYNAGVGNRCALTISTQKNQRRVSSASAYLYPIKDKKNLTVRKNSLVTKVLIDPATNRAHGVTFSVFNQTRTVHVRKEVILSGGTANSPQLLMLSGIGPSEHLTEKGIQVIKDLPVGYNFQNHMSFLGLTFLTNSRDPTLNETYVQSNPKYFIDWAYNRTSPYGIGGSEVLCFLNVTDRNNYYPNSQFYFTTRVLDLGMNRKTFNTVFKPLIESPSWEVLPIFMKPKSRGRVLLASNSPFDQAIIDPHFFTDPSDLENLLNLIPIVLSINKSRAFRRYNSRLSPYTVPECKQYSTRSREYWKCVIEHLTYGKLDPVGTCKMGPDSDTTSVVDPRLRVRGIQGLRVIDASIMPIIPASHMWLPSVMVGEKGAAMIKEDYNVSS